MQITVRGEEFNVDVVSFYEYPRGEDGTCALCKGDPCAEYSDKDSMIYKIMRNDDGSWSGELNCPVCDGRPT